MVVKWSACVERPRDLELTTEFKFSVALHRLRPLRTVRDGEPRTATSLKVYRFNPLERANRAVLHARKHTRTHTHARTHAHKHTSAHRQTDRQTDRLFKETLNKMTVYRERQRCFTERQRERQRKRERDRDRQIDRPRQTDRQTESNV